MRWKNKDNIYLYTIYIWEILFENIDGMVRTRISEEYIFFKLLKRKLFWITEL